MERKKLAFPYLADTNSNLIDAFGPYRPEGITSSLAIANLSQKLQRPEFRGDLDRLTSEPPNGYDIDTAGQLIIDRLLALL